MLVKIQLPPQKKQIELLDEITFVGEVIGSTETSTGYTVWIINPKSLILSDHYSGDSSESTSLTEFLSLILVKKEDVFKLKVEPKNYWDVTCESLDVKSAEEVANFPVIDKDSHEVSIKGVNADLDDFLVRLKQKVAKIKFQIIR